MYPLSILLSLSITLWLTGVHGKKTNQRKSPTTLGAHEDAVSSHDVSPFERWWACLLLPRSQFWMFPSIEIPGFRQTILRACGPGWHSDSGFGAEFLHHRRTEGGPALEFWVCASIGDGIDHHRLTLLARGRAALPVVNKVPDRCPRPRPFTNVFKDVEDGFSPIPSGSPKAVCTLWHRLSLPSWGGGCDAMLIGNRPFSQTQMVSVLCCSPLSADG